MIYIVAAHQSHALDFAIDRGIDPNGSEVTLVTNMNPHTWQGLLFQHGKDKVYVLASTPDDVIYRITNAARKNNFQLGDSR